MKNLIFFIAFVLTNCMYAQIPGVLELPASTSIEDAKTAGVSLCFAGDVNNDGIGDFISQGYYNPLSGTFGTTLHVSDGPPGHYQSINDNDEIKFMHSGSVISVDIDNDGDWDVFNVGATSTAGSMNPLAEMLFRSSNGYSSNTSFIGVYNARAVFIDFDNDGDYDLFYQGIDVNGNIRLLGYRYDGGTSFTKIVDNSVDALHAGSLTVGDINGDGFDDLFSTGLSVSSAQAYILLNNQSFGYTLFTTGFTGVSLSSAPLKNINGSAGDEIILSGKPQGGNAITEKYENDGSGNYSAPQSIEIPNLSSSTIAFLNPYKNGTIVTLSIGKQNGGNFYGGFHVADASGDFNFLNSAQGAYAGAILEFPDTTNHVVYMGETANLPTSNPIVVFLENKISNNPDTDGDGVTDADENADNTDPNDPCDFILSSQTVEPSTAWKNNDCDNDGLSNEAELNNGTDPLNADTDGDGVPDGTEAADGTNGNNLCDFVLAHQTLEPSTAWNNADCDSDGLSNAEELGVGTDPLNPDTDNDGVLDGDDECPLEGLPGQNQTNGENGCNVLGVDENSITSFTMYPNPTTGRVTIELENQISDVQISVVTMLGQIVLESKETIFDVSGLASGIYLVQITSEQGASAKRLVKQ